MFGHLLPFYLNQLLLNYVIFYVSLLLLNRLLLKVWNLHCNPQTVMGASAVSFFYNWMSANSVLVFVCIEGYVSAVRIFKCYAWLNGSEYVAGANPLCNPFQEVKHRQWRWMDKRLKNCSLPIWHWCSDADAYAEDFSRGQVIFLLSCQSRIIWTLGKIKHNWIQDQNNFCLVYILLPTRLTCLN